METQKLTVGPFEMGRFCQASYRKSDAPAFEVKFVAEGVWFGTTQQHPAPQWYLDVYDLDAGKHRTYALAGFLEGGGT